MSSINKTLFSTKHVIKEYLIVLKDESLKIFLDETNIRSIGVKTNCYVQLTSRILNRKVNAFKFIKYAIVRITGQDECAIRQCNRLLEHQFPLYRHRKEYQKRPECCTIYSQELVPDNASLCFSFQRTGATTYQYGDILIKSPHESTVVRPNEICQWRSGDSDLKKGITVSTGKQNENYLNWYFRNSFLQQEPYDPKVAIKYVYDDCKKESFSSDKTKSKNGRQLKKYGDYPTKRVEFVDSVIDEQNLTEFETPLSLSFISENRKVMSQENDISKESFSGDIAEKPLKKIQNLQSKSLEQKLMREAEFVSKPQDAERNLIEASCQKIFSKLQDEFLRNVSETSSSKSSRNISDGDKTTFNANLFYRKMIQQIFDEFLNLAMKENFERDISQNDCTKKIEEIFIEGMINNIVDDLHRKYFTSSKLIQSDHDNITSSENFGRLRSSLAKKYSNDEDKPYKGKIINFVESSENTSEENGFDLTSTIAKSFLKENKKNLLPDKFTSETISQSMTMKDESKDLFPKSSSSSDSSKQSASEQLVKIEMCNFVINNCIDKILDERYSPSKIPRDSSEGLNSNFQEKCLNKITDYLLSELIGIESQKMIDIINQEKENQLINKILETLERNISNDILEITEDSQIKIKESYVPKRNPSATRIDLESLKSVSKSDDKNGKPMTNLDLIDPFSVPKYSKESIESPVNENVPHILKGMISKSRSKTEESLRSDSFKSQNSFKQAKELINSSFDNKVFHKLKDSDSKSKNKTAESTRNPSSKSQNTSTYTKEFIDSSFDNKVPPILKDIISKSRSKTEESPSNDSLKSLGSSKYAKESTGMPSDFQVLQSSYNPDFKSESKLEESQKKDVLKVQSLPDKDFNDLAVSSNDYLVPMTTNDIELKSMNDVKVNFVLKDDNRKSRSKGVEKENPIKSRKKGKLSEEEFQKKIDEKLSKLVTCKGKSIDDKFKKIIYDSSGLNRENIENTTPNESTWESLKHRSGQKNKNQCFDTNQEITSDETKVFRETSQKQSKDSQNSLSYLSSVISDGYNMMNNYFFKEKFKISKLKSFRENLSTKSDKNSKIINVDTEIGYEKWKTFLSNPNTSLDSSEPTNYRVDNNFEDLQTTQISQSNNVSSSFDHSSCCSSCRKKNSQNKNHYNSIFHQRKSSEIVEIEDVDSHVNLPSEEVKETSKAGNNHLLNVNQFDLVTLDQIKIDDRNKYFNKNMYAEFLHISEIKDMKTELEVLKFTFDLQPEVKIDICNKHPNNKYLSSRETLEILLYDIICRNYCMPSIMTPFMTFETFGERNVIFPQNTAKELIKYSEVLHISKILIDSIFTLNMNTKPTPKSRLSFSTTISLENELDPTDILDNLIRNDFKKKAIHLPVINDYISSCATDSIQISDNSLEKENIGIILDNSFSFSENICECSTNSTKRSDDQSIDSVFISSDCNNLTESNNKDLYYDTSSPENQFSFSQKDNHCLLETQNSQKSLSKSPENPNLPRIKKTLLNLSKEGKLKTTQLVDSREKYHPKTSILETYKNDYFSVFGDSENQSVNLNDLHDKSFLSEMSSTKTSSKTNTKSRSRTLSEKLKHKAMKILSKLTPLGKCSSTDNITDTDDCFTSVTSANTKTCHCQDDIFTTKTLDSEFSKNSFSRYFNIYKRMKLKKNSFNIKTS